MTKGFRWVCLSLSLTHSTCVKAPICLMTFIYAHRMRIFPSAADELKWRELPLNGGIYFTVRGIIINVHWNTSLGLLLLLWLEWRQESFGCKNEVISYNKLWHDNRFFYQSIIEIDWFEWAWRWKWNRFDVGRVEDKTRIFVNYSCAARFLFVSFELSSMTIYGAMWNGKRSLIIVLSFSPTFWPRNMLGTPQMFAFGSRYVWPMCVFGD